jgi:GMP synthase-like glutamine amidotransferase
MLQKRSSQVRLIIYATIVMLSLFLIAKPSLREVSADTTTPQKTGKIYIFVNFQEEESYYEDGPSRGRVKARLEQISGERCLVIPYQELNMTLVEELNPLAIVMSGFSRRGNIEKYAGVCEVLNKCEIPMMCFCGSHQLIGWCITKDSEKPSIRPVGAMRKILPDEDFPRVAKSKTSDISQYFLASGFFPIKRVQDDPIFAGFPEQMIMKCSHYCELKILPPDFELLASSGHCKIAMIKHKSRVLYGTQFHPEAYSEPWMDGKKLLENFATIVKKYWEEKK